LAAREDFAKRKVPVTYHNVKEDRQAMARMLEASKGARQVPVIVEDGKVSIGFGGT
jgi:glutaredoxin 3